ncbi:MAG: B12-binding domain-containing radical SAM protein [Chitinivibrionales bacterium]
MRIRFIYPKFIRFLEGHAELDELVRKHLLGNYSMPPSLAIPTLAAITPDQHQISLTDDNIGQPIDFDEETDLVAISFFTPQASRAYEIADRFRAKGTRVVVGGMHPSLRPKEAAEHADAVCIGEGEGVWPTILEDAEKGDLKQFYSAETPWDMSRKLIPRREIFSTNLYTWDAHLVQTTRGCPVRCDGCPIPPKEGYTVRLRPVDAVIEDIKSMPYKEFYFTDDTIMLPGKKYQKYILRLMERIEELDVSIFLASTMMMIPDPEFYKQLRKGGAASMYTIFGFDRNSRQLFSADCTAEHWQKMIDLVHMNEDAGIHFFASYGIGFDYMDESTADRILKFSEQAGVDCAEFFIHTPFPGTPFGDQCEKEDRILHRNYHKWNTGNVVFKPRNFTPEQLQQSFYHLWKSFFRDKDPKETIKSFTVNDADKP